MRAVVYARYSSENQRDASIEDQLRQCQAFLVGKSWSFVRAYEDRAMSGASAFRPAYQRMREDSRAGTFDVAVAVSLDRFSRDQEDTAGLYKRLKHLGIPIITIAEGEVTPLHVAFAGAMNSMALTLLAEKTWTGLEGRVLQGCSGGGIAYGYRQDETRNGKQGDAYKAGKGDRGYRIVDPVQAEVVRRIFGDYAAGVAPRAIAFTLNHEGVPGPRGAAWAQSTINGNRQRGTGILNNELYVGRLVWNRLEYVKDPDTGKRVSRLNPTTEWRIVDVPELRIVPSVLWDQAKERQLALDAKLEGKRDPIKNRRSGICDTRRPQHLLSGSIRCGACGGGMSLVGGTSYGCSTARNKGTCANRRTIKRRELEAMVLEGLKAQLMAPDAVKEFVGEFTAGSTVSMPRGEPRATGHGMTSTRSSARSTPSSRRSSGAPTRRRCSASSPRLRRARRNSRGKQRRRRCRPSSFIPTPRRSIAKRSPTSMPRSPTPARAPTPARRCAGSLKRSASPPKATAIAWSSSAS
jgi:site-specific DNA recombinase